MIATLIVLCLMLILWVQSNGLSIKEYYLHDMARNKQSMLLDQRQHELMLVDTIIPFKPCTLSNGQNVWRTLDVCSFPFTTVIK